MSDDSELSTRFPLDRRGRDASIQTPNGPKTSEDDPKPLGQEAPEIVKDASRIGTKRLFRSSPATGITAMIGGMSVSFGAVAMAWASASVGGTLAGPSTGHLVGALAFPVGFIILLVGKSELFTENFLLPVAAVLKRRGSLRDLLKLWGLSLVFNLVGALVFAFLVTRGTVLDPQPARELVQLTMHKVDYGLWTAFVKAIFAGWLMTMMTWLLIAAEGFGPRLVIIWMIGTLIVLGSFNHVIISASEVFMGIFLGADVSIPAWLFRNFLPALAGNVVGGVVFVTLLTHFQANQQARQNGES